MSGLDFIAGRRGYLVGSLVVLAIGLGQLGAPALSAQSSVPTNEGWVTDLAGFLTPQQEQALEALMESYKAGSGNEIALLTVPDLGGRSLEGYALAVGRGWGMGEEGRNNAALLFVARNERKIRIEVGRGLEGNLTDSISGRIIRDVISPRFKQGRFYDGLREGVEAMHAAAGGEYGGLPRERARRGSRFGWVPMAIWLLFMFLTAIRAARRSRRHGARGLGTGGWYIGGTGGGFSGRSGGGGFGGFGGGGGFSGGGASGGW